MKKQHKIAVVLGVAITLGAGAALANTQNFMANVSFAAPLTLTKVKDPNFGILKANTTATYSLSTTGIVTTTAPGEVISSTDATNGQLTIAGAAAQTIDINAGNYSMHNGVTPSNARCSYDGGATVAGCSYSGVAAPGAGKTLLIGLDIATDGNQADNTTAEPSFDVTVVYN